MTRKKYGAEYGIALALQAVFFYGGFFYALKTDLPPVYRLVDACVFFPLATIAAWWGGHTALMKRGEKHYAVLQLTETLPVRIFLGIILASVIIAIMSLAGAY
jgi:hypothetical protein